MNNNMNMMVKVGAAGGLALAQDGSYWDEKGKGDIAKIFVSYGTHFICSLQFLFVEDGHFVLSDLHGAHKYNFATVVLDYPSEYLTGINGTYYANGMRSITFHTNKGSYGPYGGSSSSPYGDFNFQIGDDRSFGGFHGTKRAEVIQSIGIYVKTITSSMMTSSTDSQVKKSNSPD